MHAQYGVSAKGNQPNVPPYALPMNIEGFHEFLLERLESLSQEMRWSLKTTLDQSGWPLHLRAMEIASWQLGPGASWDPEDQDALMVLSKHNVKVEDIARLFFEGRTVEDCQLMIDMLQVGLPVESIEDENETEVHVESSKIASSSAMSPTPSGTPLARTPFTKRLIEVSSSAARASSTPPFTDSRKDWDQADRDIVWNALHEGLTPKQIQTQRLPFRSESAIQTRMSTERKLRGVQPMGTKWSENDDNLVLKLGSEGVGFQDIAPRLSRERTPKKIEARYHNLRKQAEVRRMSAEFRVNKSAEDEEMTEQRMQIDFAGDDGSEYEDETAPAVQPPRKLPTARKTVPSNSTPKASPKKTPSSIAPIRNKLLNSLSLSSEDKKELRKALNKTSWPTRLMSVEEYNSPLPRNGARWTEQDAQALGCIRETVPSLHYKFIANFFPGRSETAIRHQYNTRVNPGSNNGARKA
ncbi:hypothetical protein SLS60_004375 [Paraconiothyrium brasiliense]|uniref:Myb-like domain-containing protein n=1 Tax=Paraconiothyrium brasiliense TaxID=300254 RepID=A0ABR3RK64_9PLEO